MARPTGRRSFSLYFYRGETIEPFAEGWCWAEETTRGNLVSPVYQTIEDTKNAIRKYLDGTNKTEPRIVGKCVWDADERNWHFERGQ